MNKKRMTLAVSLVVGIVTLSSAVLANFANSNGYTVYKNAIKDLLKEENYTLNLKATLAVDGQEIGTAAVKELVDKNGDVKHNMFTSSSEAGSEESKSAMYYQDGMWIHYREEEGAYAMDEPNPYPEKGYLFDMGQFTNRVNGQEDTETAEKMIHFVELLSDMVVGDLKNNFVYISDDGNRYNYAINLDSFQIPELYNAGLSAMFSAAYTGNNNGYDQSQDPLVQLGMDPVVKNANCAVSVDDKGRMLENNIDITLEGNGHSISVKIDGTVGEYGTTQPERLDLSSVKTEYTSEQTAKRISELEKLLEKDSLTEDQRENYEHELKYLQKEQSGVSVIGGADSASSIEIVYPE